MRVGSVQLGEALELAYGKNLPKSNRSDGSIPVYGSNGIAGWHDTALVEEPTVIVGRKGSAGAVQYVDQPCFPIDTTYFVRPQPDYAFDMKFVYFLLRHLNLSRLATATGVPGLTREDAYRERITVPRIEEQRRIVNLLSRAEGIVRLRREAQHKAAELIPAIFLDLFGDPANPKRWPLLALGELLAACDYGTSKKASPDIVGVPVLRMGNVTYEGELDLADLKHVELDEDELAKQSLLPGDLLFNRTNSKELVGKTGIWDGRWPAVAASYFIRLRVDAGRVLPFYVWAVMNSRHMKRRLFQTARGAIGQANINTRELKALRIALPPMDLQHQFAAKAAAVRSIVARQTAALATAQATFDALLHRAFAA